LEVDVLLIDLDWLSKSKPDIVQRILLVILDFLVHRLHGFMLGLDELPINGLFWLDLLHL